MCTRFRLHETRFGSQKRRNAAHRSLLMDSLKHDWLAGGFVPRRGGIGSFLPILKPTPPRAPRSFEPGGPGRPAPQAARGSARSARKQRRDPSPRGASLLTGAAGARGGSSAREPLTAAATVARHQVASALLDAMGAPSPASVACLARRPTTRENARGLMCEHGLDQPTVAAARFTGRKVRESAGPVAALRAAKHIGLRVEVEHCAATVLQAVLRTRKPKKNIHLHRAATTIQNTIRFRNDVRHRRARVAKMDDGARDEHRAKARQRELENMKRFFHERFQEWAAEQSAEQGGAQRQASQAEAQDKAQLAAERQKAEDEERDRAEAAREAEMIRSRERLRQEHGHRQKRREQILRHEQIKKNWEEIDSARIKSVELEQKRRVVQEKRSVRRLHHQILSILLESWRVHTVVRRRLERANVASMIPSSMLAIEKQIAWRKSQEQDGELTAQVHGRAAPSEQVITATRGSDLGTQEYSPRDVGLIHSAMHVFQGNGRQALTRGFLVWKLWCACLKTDATATRSQSKLLCLFRFYLAAARGVEFTSASASFTSAAAQFSADASSEPEPSPPAVSAEPQGPSLGSTQPPLLLVLEDTEEDEGEDEGEGEGEGEDTEGDHLPELGSARGNAHARQTPRGEQTAPPRLANGAQPMHNGNASPPSGQSLAEWKLASYQLPSLALVRTSVRAQLILSPRAHACASLLRQDVTC